MTTEAASAFAERLKTDEAFQAKLAGASREERLTLAKAEGFDLSADDIGAVKQALGITELSEEELEKVAGGSGTASIAMSIVTAAGVTVGTVGLGAAAAAATV